MVWYSHLFKNIPQFVLIHTVKGSSIVNEAEVDVFLKFPCFFCDPVDVGNLISDSSAAAASTAAAKSLQWFPTRCDPRDSSPPGSPVPGIR